MERTMTIEVLYQTDEATVIRDNDTGIVASDKSEQGANEKMSRMIARTEEFKKVYADVA
jgi:hypothetical protein